jgi:hypothetical protein
VNTSFPPPPPLMSDHTATRSIRAMAASSRDSWGEVTQWMQLTGQVSMASCRWMAGGGYKRWVGGWVGGWEGGKEAGQGQSSKGKVTAYRNGKG